MDVRMRTAVPVVEGHGFRYRQHLGSSEAAHQLFSSEHRGFGTLRLFDDFSLDAGARASFQAHDGLQTIVYVLRGDLSLTRDGGEPAELTRGVAARITGGHGARYEASDRTAGSSRFLVAAVVAPNAHAQAPLAMSASDPVAPGLVWLAAGPEAEPSARSLLLGSATRLGIASLAPGIEIRFPSAVARGLFLDVIEGQIELNSQFLNEGDDAKLSLESRAVRIQGASPARIVIADVPLGFVQEL
jgi:redox-sensitive bicupin YhaK (pirin superfamily)